MSFLFALAALAAPPPAPPAAAALAPSEIVAAAPAADWVTIPPADLLVMDLAPDAAGRARRVVIQLMPAPFARPWIGNIRALAKAHWWDGLSINRVQDNYVVQWGDANAEDKAKAKPLPPGLAVTSQDGYVVRDLFSHGARSGERQFLFEGLRRDAYAPMTTFRDGWAVAGPPRETWPVHCYGTVGVGRDMPPDAGSGAELYAVIGQAPRHLDRNIAVVGRVIEGIEHLSSLPRGTGPLGFYEKPGERVPIASVRLGSEVSGLPTYQYLSDESRSFAAYADARANRRDSFFVAPAGGVDICNLPVPVRRAP